MTFKRSFQPKVLYDSIPSLDLLKIYFQVIVGNLSNIFILFHIYKMMYFREKLVSQAHEEKMAQKVQKVERVHLGTQVLLVQLGKRSVARNQQ